MSDQPSSNSMWPTFVGSLGAILIFVLIVFLSYLPNIPEPIDKEVAKQRQAQADEARAAGTAKITQYAVKSDGSIQIPVDAAMDFVVEDYND